MSRLLTDCLGYMLCHPDWQGASRAEIADRLAQLGYAVTADAIGKQQQRWRSLARSAGRPTTDGQHVPPCGQD